MTKSRGSAHVNCMSLEEGALCVKQDSMGLLAARSLDAQVHTIVWQGSKFRKLGRRTLATRGEILVTIQKMLVASFN